MPIATDEQSGTARASVGAGGGYSTSADSGRYSLQGFQPTHVAHVAQTAQAPHEELALPSDAFLSEAHEQALALAGMFRVFFSFNIYSLFSIRVSFLCSF